jgi:hypothetical protein
MASSTQSAFHRQGPFRIGGAFALPRYVRPPCREQGGEPCPHARWLRPYGPGSRAAVAAATHRSDPCDACFALGSASAPDFSEVGRVRRLGLGPRSPPIDLAIDPARMTGEEASMRPAVVACRLLQPLLLATYEHDRELRPSQHDGDRNPLRGWAHVVTRSFARNEADVPRATNPASPPAAPLSPVKAWRLRC